MKINYLLSIKKIFDWRFSLLSFVILISITIYLTFNFITIESPHTTVITTAHPVTKDSTKIDQNTTIGKSKSSISINGTNQIGTINQINGDVIYNFPLKENNSSPPQVKSSPPDISPPFQEINEGNDGSESRTTASGYIQR